MPNAETQETKAPQVPIWPPVGRAAEVREVYIRRMDVDDLALAIARGDALTTDHLAHALTFATDPDELDLLTDKLGDAEDKARDAAIDTENAEDERDAAYGSVRRALTRARIAVKAMDAARIALTTPAALIVPGALVLPAPFDEAAKELATLLSDLEAFAESNRI